MDATKFKVTITVILLTIGIILGVTLSIPDDITVKQSNGVVIDFGDRVVTWTNADTNVYDSGTELLDYACDHNGYAYAIDPDNHVTDINGTVETDTRSWAYWGIVEGESDWKKIDPTSDPRDYVVTSWAYCSSDEVPAVGVDALGNSIYGYPRTYSVVSMSPSVTEILGSIGATVPIVGVDMYSDHPSSIKGRVNSGDISIIGGYTNPSFELVMKCNADMVIGDGSQYVHSEVCKKLIKNGSSAVLLYDGTDIESILDNIFIVGRVMGYNLAADSVLMDIEDAMGNIVHRIYSSSESKTQDVLIALSGDKAPWAAGSDTYASNCLDLVKAENILSDNSGWVHISSEVIAKGNPSKIIVVAGDYRATESDYEALLRNLSPEWKSTDAYKNGEIYLICESAASMASRSSPRIAQVMELFGRFIQSDVFTDLEIPKYVGDNYTDYLTYTKQYSYDE